MKKKKIFLGLALAAASVLTLASCGDTEEETAQSSEAAQSSEIAQSSEVAQSSEAAASSETAASSEAAQSSEAAASSEAQPSSQGGTESSQAQESSSSGQSEDDIFVSDGFGTKAGVELTTWKSVYDQLDAAGKLAAADDKGRRKTNVDITIGNYFFQTGVQFESNGTQFNSQGKTIEVTLTGNNNNLYIAGTYQSGTAGTVQLVKKSDGTVVRETEKSYSSKDSVSISWTDIPAGEYKLVAKSINMSYFYTEKAAELVNVSFETEGSDVSSIKVVKGDKIGELPTTQLSGSKFVGWYTANNELVTENTVINDDTVLYAVFTALTPDEIATVSFVANIDVTFDSIDVEKGKTITLPSKDVEGYRFDGWYTDAGRTTPFVATTAINESKTLYGKYVKVWTLTYLDNDNTVIISKTVDDSTKFSTLEKVYPTYPDGKIFEFWSEDGTHEYVDASEITSDVTLKPVYKDDDGTTEKITITSVEGNLESASLKLNAYDGATDYAVYDLTGGKNKKLTKNDYYVITSSSSVQIELFGLTEGNHKVLVAPVIGGADVQAFGAQAEFEVEAYDRSGYAHFNYTDGVGAYNDDGTLKDNAIVLYVTDDNKNTVELNYGGKTVKGIGNILNSVGQECNEAGHEGECKRVSDGKTYYGTANDNQGIILDLANGNVPLVVRFVGTVSNSGLYKTGTFDAKNASPQIDGLTAYDSYDNGGSIGDNGHMARMKSGKNITLEGVGNDATIDGWGIHFMCESAYSDLGKSFEVRNLTFINNPEDALGMEGQQSGSVINASVERCWIHHNTFLKPTISNPAESDKKDGDGSCDFKRGMYYTLSYNYFEYCHKTSILGSSDSSLQFNISLHHNLWFNCGSRIPLARQANVHFYNNYICCDANDPNTELSYVTSLRADAYIFSENNYYDGCKNIFDKSGGTAKVYGCEIIQCFGNNNGTIVSSREETVAGNCAYNGTSLQNFDTNSELFYYDSVNKKSDCYLTSAVDARIEVIASAGSRYRTELDKTTLKIDPTYTKITPTESVTIGSEIIPTSKNNGTYGGVVWTGIQGYDSKTGVKARGQFATFKVTRAVTMNISITASSSDALNAGSVVKSDGTVMINGSGSTVLLPGIYTIISCQKDKDSYVTSLKFDEYNSEELNQQLIDEYEAAHDAIPASITYSDSCYNAIKNAMTKYNALGDLQSQITDYSDVTTAYNTYKNLGIAYVEAEINKIQTPVTASNSSLVIAARNAYDALISKVSDATVSNLSTLTAAEAEMASLSVDIFLAQVAEIPSNITYTDDCLAKIVSAETAYAKLDDTQKNDSNVKAAYATLTAARAEYDSLAKTAAVDALLDNAATLTECETAYAEYQSLTNDEKNIIGTETINVFKAKYTVLLINSISNPVVRADKPTVEAARALYDSIDSAYILQVTNYNVLVAAEEALAGMSAEEVTKTLTASDFTITGVSTTAFSGEVWSGGSIVGISKVTYTDPSKIVLNATRYDASVSFVVSISTDGTNWTQVGSQQPGSNKTAADLEYTITTTGDLYIKIEIVGTKPSDNPKQGTINSIKITCYE